MPRQEPVIARTGYESWPLAPSAVRVGENTWKLHNPAVLKLITRRAKPEILLDRELET